jgi:hypothetical protein
VTLSDIFKCYQQNAKARRVDAENISDFVLLLCVFQFPRIPGNLMLTDEQYYKICGNNVDN